MNDSIKTYSVIAILAAMVHSAMRSVIPSEYEYTILYIIAAIVAFALIVFLIIKLKHYKLMIFSKFNLDYINAFLQRKAIVTNKTDEQNLVFKLSDVNWRLFYDGHRLSISAGWGIDSEEGDLIMATLAANALNADRYMVKCYITKNDTDNPSPESPSHIVYFTVETLCYTKKAFKQIYEFAMFALIDGVQFHQKLYQQYIEDAARQRQQIDFDTNKTSNMPTA